MPGVSPSAPADQIAHAIHVIRGHRVMLDADLAVLYGVTTKRLNQQLRRNRRRFPADFAFQLTAEEVQILKSQIATSSAAAGTNLRSQSVTSSSVWGGRRYTPVAFTEHGADSQFRVVFDAIRQLMEPEEPKRIGFRAVRAPDDPPRSRS